MKKLTIVKEYNLLDIEDIEQALSKEIGTDVTISMVDCSLAHCIPADTNEPCGAYLEFRVGDYSYYSFDLFVDEETGESHYWKGEQLALDEPWLPEEELFNFNVSAFQSFESWMDSSD